MQEYELFGRWHRTEGTYDRYRCLPNSSAATRPARSQSQRGRAAFCAGFADRQLAQAALAKGLSYRHAWGLRELKHAGWRADYEVARTRVGAVGARRGVLRAQRLSKRSASRRWRAKGAGELNRRLSRTVGEITDSRIAGYALRALVGALAAKRIPAGHQIPRERPKR